MVVRNIVTPTSWPPGSPADFIRGLEELFQAANGGVEGSDVIFSLEGNTGDVTLAGAFNYLEITNQVITLNAVDLATDVTGALDLTANVGGALTVANGGTGGTTAATGATGLGLGTGNAVVFLTSEVGAGGFLVSGTKVVGAQAAAIASLTNSTGGAATGDLVAIGDTSTSNEGSKINDNLTELNVKLDAILAILRPAGHGLIAT